jgi:dihydrofolate reductase
MRRLVVTENITLDGVIEMIDDWFDPRQPDDPEAAAEMAAVEREHQRNADAVLLGRQTYQDFEGYWPKQTDDPTGITDYLNETRKYVLSTTLVDPEWQNTTVLRGPLDAEVAALKELPGKDIVATGSISVVTALVGSGLVDEYRLMVHPYVQGRGKRLFEHGADAGRMQLVEARPFRTGVVLMRYRPTPAARG